ncbi:MULTISPECIES: MATE family efflux transporter [unclassified Enterococcus]|uniref:MATE family efflux transporter n=1 Tax=unclassified Enterococcus TaxID=2608891 RepID=UPI0015548580|nr:MULTISPECIES: MATE family efflux transporter [unclassified Enterococcus]MBS7576251.1 MATE family efflux transporter [Enterococcus sp. MMGLQ5-2]MBS7583484.1 MATE family efflux transporter [Enterococcus sp. MMGLQ5-1]NPD11346.1 MATE family efflux transporter [Enterococcus sp. MMGLQ5-1]NPD36089.1 MATE family efflux transporter [Enterococcus sp. MMGLQ5-2]
MTDLTKGNIFKIIIAFSLPLIVGNVFQQLYTTMDTLIVGKTLGKTALAAVGSTSSLSFLILGFAQGLTAGLSIITAQKYGANDLIGVKKSFATGIIYSIIITVILTILSLAFVEPLLIVMQTPKDILRDAQIFIGILFIGTFASIGFNLLSNIIRAIGDARTPLFFLVVASIVNIILEFVFILYFKWGVAGAAFATVIAQTLSVALGIIHIKRRIPILTLRKDDFRLDKQDFIEHARVGFPMAFQTSIIAIGTVIMQIALNTLGTDAVAAQSAASKIDQLAMLPLIALGTAIATFTAQNFGAKEYQRIIDGIKAALVIAVSFAIIAGIVINLFGNFFTSWFINQGEGEVFRLANIYYLINGSMYWLLAILFILRYMIQGLGKGFIPTLAGIMELIARIVAAIIGTMFFGFAGTVAANPLAWLGSVAILLPSTIISIRQLKKWEQDKQQLDSQSY